MDEDIAAAVEQRKAARVSKLAAFQQRRMQQHQKALQKDGVAMDPKNLRLHNQASSRNENGYMMSKPHQSFYASAAAHRPSTTTFDADEDTHTLHDTFHPDTGILSQQGAIRSAAFRRPNARETNALHHSAPTSITGPGRDLSSTSSVSRAPKDSNQRRNMNTRNLEQVQETQPCDAILDLGILQCERGFFCRPLIMKAGYAVIDRPSDTVNATAASMAQDANATGQCVPIKSKHNQTNTMLQAHWANEREHEGRHNRAKQKSQGNMSDTNQARFPNARFVCPENEDMIMDNCPATINGATSFDLFCYDDGCNDNGPTIQNFGYASNIYCKESYSCRDFEVAGNTGFYFGNVFCQAADSCIGTQVDYYTDMYCQVTDACRGVDAARESTVYCEAEGACYGISVSDSDVLCKYSESCNDVSLSEYSFMDCAVENACQEVYVGYISAIDCDGKYSCQDITVTSYSLIDCDYDYACQNVEVSDSSRIECNGLYACAGVRATGFNFLDCEGPYYCSGIAFEDGNIRCYEENSCQGFTPIGLNEWFCYGIGSCYGITATDDAINCFGRGSCEGVSAEGSEDWYCFGGGSCDGIYFSDDAIYCNFGNFLEGFPCTYAIDAGFNRWLCIAPNACIGLTVTEDILICNSYFGGGCYGTTAVDSIIKCYDGLGSTNPYGCDGLTEVCFQPDERSTCNDPVFDPFICRTCIYDDSCVDRSSPGTLGDCSAAQLVDMCIALSGSDFVDPLNLKFYNGCYGDCYYPCQIDLLTGVVPQCDGINREKSSKSTKACKASKASKAASFKGTKAPSFKGKGSKSGSTSVAVPRPTDVEAEMAAELESETEQTMDAAVDHGEPPSLPSVTDSVESAQHIPSFFAPMMGVFGVLLAMLMCVNFGMLWTYWRGTVVNGSKRPGDPPGTKVTVASVKGGMVMVKKVIPTPNGGGEVVMKTLYPNKQAAIGAGYVPEIA
jgi:hypothetical protein